MAFLPAPHSTWAAGGVQSASIATNRCSPGENTPVEERNEKISEARAEKLVPLTTQLDCKALALNPG